MKFIHPIEHIEPLIEDKLIYLGIAVISETKTFKVSYHKKRYYLNESLLFSLFVVNIYLLFYFTKIFCGIIIIKY